jgi:hypothetical protein
MEMCANTPAAKGRVERALQTLQDRQELRLQRDIQLNVGLQLLDSHLYSSNVNYL